MTIHGIWAPIARLEQSARILAIAKLANVVLAMLWGFAVTFVFVRLLPLSEFKHFLVLVAFANFTVSADFGFSGIIYARLRRFRLGQGADGFRAGEISLLFAFMALVMLAGALLITGLILGGVIATERPVLFLAFYALSALNIFGLLAKRALAALDHNLLWEGMDLGRRLLSLGLLLAALVGVPILWSVFAQIALMLLALGSAFLVAHRAIGGAAGPWRVRLAGASAMMRGYGRDMGATMALTLSDVAAYNAPYLGIALATRDPRPLLVFDFVFKISRGLSAVIRALVEAALPHLTDAYHGGRPEAVRAQVARLRWLALGSAAAVGLPLLALGPALSRVLFDGKAVLGRGELALLVPLLLGLAMICVSTYVHNGLGRFAVLLPPSFAFLAGSVLSIALGGYAGLHATHAFAAGFLAAYALVHAALGVRHDRMLRGIAAA